MSTDDTEQLDRLEPDYLANYGLTEAPFSNQHDDRFLFLDTERAQRLNLLQHMTQYSNLLLIVLGEEGVGKTSLLGRFITTKGENWHISQVTANTFMDAGQLLFRVAQGFGVRQMPHGNDELQEMLYTQVATYHHNDQIPILLIDDAHELPKDALLTIFHLADAQVDNANLLRIILFAEPQIEKALNARDIRPLRERITHTMNIPPLDEDATAEYLKHRMAAAGFNGGSPFTPKMVKRIYKASAGNPARINQLAHETLDKGDFEREEMETMVNPEKPRRQYKITALIAVGIVLVALFLAFQNSIHRLFQGKSTKTQTLPLSLGEKPSPNPSSSQAGATVNKPQVPTGSTASTVSDNKPVAAPAEQSKLKEKIIPLESSQTAAPQQPAANAVPGPANSPPPVAVSPVNQTSDATTTAKASLGDVPEATVAEQKTPVTPTIPLPKVSSVVPNPVPASDKLQTIMVHGEGFTEDSRVFVRWTDNDHEIPAERVKMMSTSQLQVRLTVGREHGKWQLHVDNPGRGSSNILTFNVATAAYQQEKTNDWSLAQAPDKFTLQLFGSLEASNAQAFIRQHQLGQRAHYFVSEHKGKTWYSVVYGVYPDKATARTAIKSLPASLKKIKPWVRRFDDIQASINASSQSSKAVQPKKPPQPRASAELPASSVFSTALPGHGNIEQNESWIWSQDPSYFTLQLLGARELASVKKFMRQYTSLADRAVYFHTRHNGRDWYAVIYGVYPDKQKARAAIKRLPSALQKASPWIRSYASIHAELSRTE